jgi:peptidoglycan hydrolase CwlO-like protein
MADKKVRSLEERKNDMLAKVAELEAKELVRYQKEFDTKTARFDKLGELITQYSEERRTTAARITELSELIGELNGSPEESESFDSVALEAV